MGWFGEDIVSGVSKGLGIGNAGGWRDEQQRRILPFLPEQTPMPEYKGYDSIRGPGGLLSQKDLNLDYGPSIANNLNTGAIQGMRDVALAAPGTGAWEQMARQRQGLEEQSAGDKAQALGASAEAMGRSALASKGGLSSGASERLAKGGMRDRLMAMQDVGRQGQMQRADIGVNAEQQRLGMLGQLSGQELNYLNPQFKEREMQMGSNQFNIQNALQQKQNEEAAKLREYQMKMGTYASGQAARAQLAAQPGPQGLLGSLLNPFG